MEEKATSSVMVTAGEDPLISMSRTDHSKEVS